MDSPGHGAEVDCLVPAAGTSSRMGTWKLLMPWGSTTVIQTVVDNALAACTRVILVTGYRADHLRELYRSHERVRLALNPRYQDGFFSSIQAGVALVGTSRFFVALGDMPLIEPAVYRSLLTAAGENRVDAVRPIWQGRPGHPVLIASRLIPEILRRPREATMQQVLRSARVLTLEMRDASVYLDIDRPEDYKRLVRGEGPPGG